MSPIANWQSTPQFRYKKLLFLLLQEGLSLGIITQKEFDYMYVKHQIVPIFHGLPKIHKNKVPPPLRAIIAEISSLCENLSRWVDTHSQPLVLERPSDLKDSKQVHFLWQGMARFIHKGYYGCHRLVLEHSLLCSHFIWSTFWINKVVFLRIFVTF